jgi:hypothetical protein
VDFQEQGIATSSNRSTSEQWHHSWFSAGWIMARNTISSHDVSGIECDWAANRLHDSNRRQVCHEPMVSEAGSTLGKEDFATSPSPDLFD